MVKRRRAELPVFGPKHRVDLLDERVRALAATGDAPGAIQTLRAAIARNPTRPQLRPYLIELLCNAGDYEAARNELEACRFPLNSCRGS